MAPKKEDCKCYLETTVVTIENHKPETPTFSKLAERKNEEGNFFYKDKKYREALSMYKSAIELCPNSSAYHGNKASCLMMLGQYEKALEDVYQALQLDKHYAKGYLQEVRCHIALGDVSSASSSLQRIQELYPDHPSLSEEKKHLSQLKFFIEEGRKAYKKKDFQKVIFCMDKALIQAKACTTFRLIKAECMVFLKRYQEAKHISNDILRIDASNVDALYIKGMCLYYQDILEKAVDNLQEVLKLIPYYKKAEEIYKKAKQLQSKKEDGSRAFKKGNYKDAYAIYTEALNIDLNNVQTNSKLYFNRAVVCLKMNRTNEAIEDCSKAIDLDKEYVKAYLRRAKCYMDTQRYEEAVRDYETLYQKNRTLEYQKVLDRARLELLKSKRKNYYQILGLNKHAAYDDIKKAYHKQALLCHPDRHPDAKEDEQQEQEKKFKEISEAYSILSDPRKRSHYDKGLDITGMNGFRTGGMDPNDLFEVFLRNQVFRRRNQFFFSDGFQPV
ncbi:dnaJ homolog subfamily C member 7-like isoform X2 [Limulus polyphemus]|uniref:DnaJ homolog subfamily C member 7-like isoform X2 n=1 Tax=Limulus polyphemus TaxID=6850 RepID=A0ABM1BCV6_LIMPO|nr:dnaJ homolog subfamily C member 7-like isoform X2 [Limulus polyphemus]